MSDHNKPHGTKRRGSSKKMKARRAKLERKADSDDIATVGENSETHSDPLPTGSKVVTEAEVHEEPKINIEKIPEKTDDEGKEAESATVAEKADEIPDDSAAVETDEKEVPVEMASVDEDKNIAEASDVDVADFQVTDNKDRPEELSAINYDPAFIDDSSVSPSILQIDERNEDSEDLPESIVDDICASTLLPLASESSSSEDITAPRSNKTCALPSMPELAEKNDDEAEGEEPNIGYTYTKVADIPLPPMVIDEPAGAGQLFAINSSNSAAFEDAITSLESKDDGSGLVLSTTSSSSDNTVVDIDDLPLESKDAVKPADSGEMTSASSSDSATLENGVTTLEFKDADKPAGLGDMASVSDSATVETHVALSEDTETE